MFCMLINMKCFYKLMVLFFMGLARHTQSTLVNLLHLCDIWRKSGIKLGQYEIRDLTALAGSNTSLLIYYTSNVSSPLTLLSQYGILTMPFIHLINCLYNISSLLFQVSVGPCKLARWKEGYTWLHPWM